MEATGATSRLASSVEAEHEHTFTHPRTRPDPTKNSPTQPLRWWTRRRAHKRAFERAYRTYHATHTHLHKLRFERRFLTGRGAVALTERDAEGMARAWTTQFRYGDEKRRAADIRQLLPVAACLLELLDAEGWFGPP